MGKWTRRALLGTGGLIGGGLVLGLTLTPNRLKIATDDVLDGDEVLMNTWVKLAPDNKITVIVPHSEMGQGVHTSLPMMLAEEMEADWSTVSMEQAPAEEEFANGDLGRGYLMGGVSVPSVIFPMIDYSTFKIAQAMDLQITGGSTAIRFTGEHGMRRAGAAAKAMLLKAAAAEWGVAEEDCDAKLSRVSHAVSGQSASFGELANAAAKIAPPQQPVLRSPRDFTIIGREAERFDVPAKVDGSAKFGIDAEVPGMHYAAIKQSPVFGGRVVGYDDTAIQGRKGIKQVVALEDAVAVVADKYWRAKKALDDVVVQFEGGEAEGVTVDQLYQKYDDMLELGTGVADVEKGDIVGALKQAELTVDAAYRVPFLAHATMEPMNCTASVKKDSCEIWVGHQNPLAARTFAAEAVGLSPDQVTVHNFFLGGGFGRRSRGDFVAQAVKVAKAAGVPVKLVWSREEDMQHDLYRPAVSNRMQAALDDKGTVTAWRNIYVNVGQNEPLDAPHIPYDTPNQDIRGAEYIIPIPLGPWRSVGHTQHSFFNESFMDELAYKAGQDPFEFRRDHLRNAPRHRAVLELAAEKAGWGTPLPAGHGRGIALEESFNSIVAEVVEASVSDAGQLKIHKVTAAVDCGTAINPNTVEAQIQSGIVYGLTAALYGEITLDGGAVEQSNFPDYQMVRLNEAPQMDVHILNSGEALGGIGEPGTPPIAPAVANAVYAITGKRIRSLPLMNHDLSPDQPEQKVSMKKETQ